MSVKITILGSNSAVPSLRRNPSAQVVSIDENLYLIDCAEGTQLQLQRFGIKPMKFKAVFISHLHGDHFFGLVGLLSTMHLKGRTDPLHVLGPDGLEQILTMQLGFARSVMGYEIIYHTIDTTKNIEIYRDKKISVSSIPLDHRIPTAGFLLRTHEKQLNIKKEFILSHNPDISWYKRIKAGEDYIDEQGLVIPNANITCRPVKPFSYAYCSDTCYNETIIPIINGVELLYHEASFGNELQHLANEHMHSTAGEAATIALKANVGQLLIGHFSNRYKTTDVLVCQAREVFANTLAVEDGMEWERSKK